MLASEPKFGMHRVQTIGGTSKKTLGVFTKRRDAVRYCSRIREVTAAMRGRLTGNVCGGGSAEIVRN